MRTSTYSKSNSKTNSRASSRAADPNSQDELINTIDFGNLDEILSTRLNSLLVIDSLNKDTSRTKRSNNISDIIISLKLPRNELSFKDREVLLDKLYHMIIKTPTLFEEFQDEVDYQNNLLDLFKILQGSKTSNEIVLSIRSLVSLIISNIDEAGILYNEDPSSNIFKYLERQIQNDSVMSEQKPFLIYSYSALALVLYDGSSGYGVEDMIEFINEYLLQLIPDAVENVQLIISAVYGLGSFLTLLSDHKNINEIIQKLLEDIAELFLQNDNLELARSSAMFLALCYETFQYDDDNDGDEIEERYESLPYANTYVIISRLEQFVRNSSKKYSKRDKRENRSVFRDASRTVIFYSDKKTRLHQDESTDDESLILSHIKLSKSRSLAIKSWFAFFRLIQLKWVYSSYIDTQLANNSNIQGIIREKPSTDLEKERFRSVGSTGDEAHEHWSNTYANKLNVKKKTIDVEHQRREKLTTHLEQAGLLD